MTIIVVFIAYAAICALIGSFIIGACILSGRASDAEERQRQVDGEVLGVGGGADRTFHTTTNINRGCNDHG